MGYDLHVHTTASDGRLTSQEVIEEAVSLRLEGLAITDHDAVLGLEPAQRYIAENQVPLDFIPGIEINTDVDRYDVHVLGYFIDYHNDQLIHRLLELREARRKRTLKMVKKLNDLGLKIQAERVSELARGGTIGRPHIARALVEKNYVVSIQEAFDKLISRGKPGYVPRYKFLPEEAIRLIKGAGGVPVLAHPGLIGNDQLLEQLLPLGFEGIEVYYPEHSKAEIKKYHRLAQENSLLVTGGSDYHGTPGVYHEQLGSAQATKEQVDLLRQRALERRTRNIGQEGR